MWPFFGCDAPSGMPVIQPQGRPNTLTEWEGDLSTTDVGTGSTRAIFLTVKNRAKPNCPLHRPTSKKKKKYTLRVLAVHHYFGNRMLDMISFVLLVLYSFNLVYLLVWVNKTVQEYSYCADANVPATTPSPSWISMLILLATIVHFIGLTFWGFTENPYHGREGPWIHPGDDLGILVLGLIGFCLASLGYVLFQLGKLSGTLERRRMEIDIKKRR